MKMTIEKLEELREHKMNAIAILEEESEYDSAKAVETAFNALFALDQIMWERNVAIEQLEELGLGLGQKIDGVYLTREKFDKLFKDYFCMSAPDSEVLDT
jgi:hypothetical protein